MAKYRSHMKGAGKEEPSSRKTALMIVVCVTIAISIIATTILWISLELRAGHPTSRGIEWDIQTNDGNWSMVVSYTPSGLVLTVTTLTILDDESGSPVGSMSGVALPKLTPANWSLYGAVYRKVGVETTVVVGASILVDAAIYPAGYTCVIRYDGELISQQRLG